MGRLVTDLLHTSHTRAPSPRSVLGVAQQKGEGRSGGAQGRDRPRRAWLQDRAAYGEDWDYDLIVCRDGETLERVQVKYARSDGRRILVRAHSHSLTNGQVIRTKRYTAALIDWLAVYDACSDGVFYIPANELGQGMDVFTLRLAPALNRQVRLVHDASRYREI